MTSAEHFQIEVTDGIAVVTLDRPKVNAMNQAFLAGMRQVFEEAATDDAVQGVLLRSEHGRAFSAGLDLKEVVGFDAPEKLGEFLDVFDAAFTAAWLCPKPVAAAVRGHAIAGGLVLAMACDYVALAPQSYKLGLTEIVAGVPFPRIAWEIVNGGLSPRAFRKLVYTGQLIGPGDAFDLGIGDDLDNDPEGNAMKWLRATTASPGGVFAAIKGATREEAILRMKRDPEADRRRVADVLFSDAVRKSAGALVK